MEEMIQKQITNPTAVVTGASSGIGLAIVKMLIDEGYIVYGVCRNPKKCEFHHKNFILQSVNLTQAKETEEWLRSLLNQKDFHLDLLVLNAGKGYFAPMEELGSEQIQEMVALNLTSPLVITNKLLRKLKEREGRIILIGSVAGVQISPWGSVYGATKAGLVHFGRELFHELRRSGVKVTNIIPDMTATEFYKELRFEPDKDPKSFIDADCIADAVLTVLEQRDGTVISEMIIQPERFKIKKKS